MPTAEIIVLANSRKHGGRCVAGVATATGEWVRPVSARPHGQLTPLQSCVDGRQARVLDIVRFDYVERCAEPAQPENVLVAESRWTLVESLPRGEAYGLLRPYLARGRELLGNRGAAVPEEVAAEGMEASLALVESEGEVCFVQGEPNPGQTRRRPRVRFRFARKTYLLGLTDFEIRPTMETLECGDYSPEELGIRGGSRSLVTVSLAEPHNGWHSKLAAAVLFLPD